MSGRVEQGMRVVDQDGQLIGNVRDFSSGSFLLSRSPRNDVIWVSRSAIARVESFSIVLSCGADEIAGFGPRELTPASI